MTTKEASKGLRVHTSIKTGKQSTNHKSRSTQGAHGDQSRPTRVEPQPRSAQGARFDQGREARLETTPARRSRRATLPVTLRS